MTDPIATRAALRRELKGKRRRMPPSVRRQQSHLIAVALNRSLTLRPRLHIGVYSPTAGEVELDEIVKRARGLRCDLYLPRIANWRTRRMLFVRWDAAKPLRPHRLGMTEPAAGRIISPRALDLVFVPAVAVDLRGMRLGAGGGFYDRAFAHRRALRWRRPRLIAVVYEFQRVSELPAYRWDVPVDAALSETGLHRFNRGT
jgi:5-formyltetrahydrofolate cyclo-ligase